MLVGGQWDPKGWPQAGGEAHGGLSQEEEEPERKGRKRKSKNCLKGGAGAQLC